MNVEPSITQPLIPNTMLTDERVSMPRQMARNIKAHAIEHVPQEVCGLIGGQGDDVWTLLCRCPNHAPEPLHEFRIEATHAYEFEMSCKEKGAKIRAMYHSHIGSGCEPSLSDITNLPNEFYMVIYSVRDDEIRVWRGSKPIDLQVTG